MAVTGTDASTREDSPFPGAHRENLTREEASQRSAHLEVERYEVHVDLSGAAEQGAATYPVTTRVSFEARAGESTFLDYLGDSVQQVVLNGEELDLAEEVGTARIRLRNLQEQNTAEIRSTSRYSRSGEGMHRFTDPSDGQVYLYTQYEPADSRRVFPVFEQPDLKARFRFSITGPESWQLRSNSPEVTREPAGAGLVTVRFAETEPMSSYITTLLAGPYHLVEESWRDIDLGVLCRASLARHLDAEEILTVTAQGLEFFHEEFSYGYPWGRGTGGRAKYDQVFVPEYNLGAMENPGLVTFTEKYVFDTAATDAQHEGRATTIMHEMAHMWFGDLVTMHWWDDLWLKESFADYMGTLAVDEATGWSTSWVSFANGRKAWAYVQDQLPTTHPIVADIEDLEAADQNFDGITYAKGASVLKQLAAYAGREAFREASRQYFRRHAFGNASLRDFLDVLAEVTGKDMQAWAQSWLQTAGLPELSAEISEGAVWVRESGIDPVDGSPVHRPHVIGLGVYSLTEQGTLALETSLPMQIPAEAAGEPIRVTSVPQDGQPRLILPNEQDLTYAKLRLDPGSVAAALRFPMEDPLGRATVWAALWSMVRDGELPASRFLDAVMDHGLQVAEIGVVQSLLRQADRALELYTPVEQREELQLRFASRLAHYLTETDGAAARQDHQRAAARVLGSLSRRHGSQLHLLSSLLDGGGPDAGIARLAMDEELRWSFLQALAAHGRLSLRQLDTELTSRDTARGRIAHRLAAAAFPEKKGKERAFAQAISGTDEHGQELSNDHLTAVVSGFTTDTADLTPAYTSAYFDALEATWSQMTQGQATRVVEGLFPQAQGLSPGQRPEEHPTAALTQRWLDTHTEAPAALRRIILEEQDHLLRALRAQHNAR
mgnify:CR=1 FL=1